MNADRPRVSGDEGTAAGDKQSGYQRRRAARSVPPERKSIHFEASFLSLPNDDLADEEEPNPTPDEGWYIEGEMPDGRGFTIGPDHFGPGLPSLDEALAAVRTWAEGRGMEVVMDLTHLKVTVAPK